MNRVELATAVRSRLGKRLVPHEVWESNFPYSSRPDSTPAQCDKLVNHHNGATAQLPRIRANAERYGTREAEILQVAYVDDMHFFSRKWPRAAAYGLAGGPLSGDIFEMRSFWVRWGAHVGDLEPDGIAENDEGFPLYWPLGSADTEIPEALIDIHGTVTALLVDLVGMDPKAQYGHKDVQGGTACPGNVYPLVVDWRRNGVPYLEELMLKQGAQGEAVVHYQRALRLAGAEGVRLDGVFDESVGKAVAVFKAANGLPGTPDIDGVTADLLTTVIWRSRDLAQRRQIQKLKIAAGLPVDDDTDN